MIGSIITSFSAQLKMEAVAVKSRALRSGSSIVQDPVAAPGGCQGLPGLLRCAAAGGDTHHHTLARGPCSRC
jgi:hypothetical protein